jgi:hypothetical protein
VDEVKFDFKSFLIQYRSGRVQRLMGTLVVPPLLDACTGVASRDAVIDPTMGLTARICRPVYHGGDGGRLSVLLYFHEDTFIAKLAFDLVYHGYLTRSRPRPASARCR